MHKCRKQNVRKIKIRDNICQENGYITLENEIYDEETDERYLSPKKTLDDSGEQE